MDPSVLRRLAFIKYLHSVGVTQCAAPEPLAGAGLLTLHDSIELFLQLASEHLNVTAKCSEFKDYWLHLGQKLTVGSTLTQQAAMQRLNKARVALKHHGTHPSRFDLDIFKVTASAFLNENCPIIFCVAFEEISLSEFVQPEEARRHLDHARKLRDKGALDEAAKDVAIAFDVMLGYYLDRKRDYYRQSPYDFGRSFAHMRTGLRGLSFGDYGDQHVINDMVNSLGAMQKALRIIAIGLDFPRYSHFLTITPTVQRTSGNTYYVHDWRESQRDSDMIEFCINFVIESALHLIDFDSNA